MASLAYSPYTGGSSTDTGWGVTAGALNSVYVTGAAKCWDFPWRDNLQAFNVSIDASIAQFDPSAAGAASLIYAAPGLDRDGIRLKWDSFPRPRVRKKPTITVTNNGTGALAVSSVAVRLAVDFVLGANTCKGANIPSGGTCTVQVSISPACTNGTAARSGSLALTRGVRRVPHSAARPPEILASIHRPRPLLVRGRRLLTP
jgi:hypothetical protein